MANRNKPSFSWCYLISTIALAQRSPHRESETVRVCGCCLINRVMSGAGSLLGYSSFAAVHPRGSLIEYKHGSMIPHSTDTTVYQWPTQSTHTHTLRMDARRQGVTQLGHTVRQTDVTCSTQQLNSTCVAVACWLWFEGKLCLNYITCSFFQCFIKLWVCCLVTDLMRRSLDGAAVQEGALLGRQTTLNLLTGMLVVIFACCEQTLIVSLNVKIYVRAMLLILQQLCKTLHKSGYRCW